VGEEQKPDPERKDREDHDEHGDHLDRANQLSPAGLHLGDRAQNQHQAYDDRDDRDRVEQETERLVLGAKRVQHGYST
jgi:hypothetical protein